MKIKGGGKIFAVTTEVDDQLLKSLRSTPEILQKATAEGAAYWHTGILPAHFEASAHSRYNYAQRAKNYLLQRRKKGRPDLVCRGDMRRELLHNRQIITTAAGAKLKMTARVLNLVGAANDNPDSYVTHTARNGHTRTYPNLKREIKSITDDERESVAHVVATAIESEIHPTAENRQLAQLARNTPAP